MNAGANAADQIRVLIADDSIVMRSALSRMLESSSTVRVCGTARDGVEAVEKAKLLRPDVITLDVAMPVMDGLQALKRIMKVCPCPVIMVSSATREGAEITLEALDAGAFDYLPKEDLQCTFDSLRLGRMLIEKIEAAANSPLAGKKQYVASSQGYRLSATVGQEHSRVIPRIVVIGTSTGGPKALQDILPELPADLPIGVLVVQHMPPGFTSPFAKRLNEVCRVKVREASQGEIIESGTVYIAPAGKHTTVLSTRSLEGIVRLSDEPADTMHKPSVDVTMLSVTETYGRCVLGIILTGMGSDGLQGMTAIRNAGGITIGQDEASSAVYGMPRCCAEQGVLQKIVPLPDVPRQIMHAVRYKPLAFSSANSG